MEREIERSEEFVDAFSHEVAVEQEKGKFIDNATNTQVYTPEITLLTEKQLHK